MSKAFAHTGLVQVLRQYALPLIVLGLALAVLLAGVHELVREKIHYQQQDSERQALSQLLPAHLHDNDLLADRFQLGPNSNSYQQIHLLGLGTARSGYRATMQGSLTGVILPLETAQAYNGSIVLMIGITTDGTIAGVRVLQHAETPGLGDKIDIGRSPWITGFNQHSLADTAEPQWQVKKDGGSFDEFVGATITPRAVVAAIHNALLFFQANREQLLRGSP